MIPPRKHHHHQEKAPSYPNPPQLEVSSFNPAALWQQNSGLHYDNEQQLHLNSRASSYNSTYSGPVNADEQMLQRQLRGNQTLSNQLSPDTSAFRITHAHNGNETDHPYSRAPFANMTTNGPRHLPNNTAAHPTEMRHANPAVASCLAPTPARSIRSPERREASRAEDRRLPSREVSPNTLEETFVLFIMYCNPSVPLSTDSAELRKCFHSPPKSDGKTFKIFTLFELIRKLELGELKTWAQLAIELGVEPPALEKGQSAQKVQQYAVRLKRWMHAMHVDAFFEYLLGKPHIYWTQVPITEETASEFGRDGVPPEEDLALRALLPETRPKRGRRKAEDKEIDGEYARSPAQRPRLASPTLSEEFAMARSAHPDVLGIWTSNSLPPSQNMRWRLDDAHSALSAHPHSAVVAGASHPFHIPDHNEPRSALTPSTSRSRRRHGPAVSSAWPSSGHSGSGKLRGRPPSNRSVTDGPFSTFPANPAKVGQTINFKDAGTPVEAPLADRGDESLFSFPNTSGKVSSRPDDKYPSQRPSRLHLHVPERAGGTVRLATPPPPLPTVLVNESAETNANSLSKSSFTRPPNPSDPGATYDAMDHASALREEPPNPTPLPAPPPSDPPPAPPPANLLFKAEATADRTNIDDLEAHFRLRILGAEWRDMHDAPCAPCSIETADRIVKQTIRNLRDESTTQEAFLINLAALAGGRTLMTKLRMRVVREEMLPAAGGGGAAGRREKRTVFESRWTLRFGGVEGSFTISQSCREAVAEEGQEHGGDDNEISAGSGPRRHRTEIPGDDDDDDEKTWKRKYLELQDRFYQKDDRVWGIRKSILDALAATAGEHVV